MLTPLSAEQRAWRRSFWRSRSARRASACIWACAAIAAARSLPSGAPQTVASEKPARFVFEGAIRNFPSPEVEKDNVNYLAGVREIGVRSEYTDGRDMPRLLIRSVEFEGPYYDAWPPASHRNIFVDFDRKNDPPAYARKIIHEFATRAYRRPVTAEEEAALMAVYREVARPPGAAFRTA